MDAGELLGKLFGTESTDEVVNLVDRFCASQGKRIAWRAVGDRPNNEGTIGAAGDPARALLERVTNAIDAVIERQHREHNGRPTCATPREAAQAWFGVPTEGLHGLTEAAARKLAQDSVTLVLYEGGGPSKRTVEIIDNGTGLTQTQIPKTILSLNAENKLDKFYLAGAFGQGGSATLSSSAITLIASRSLTAPETVSFTVVKYQKPVGLKLGSYVYLTVDGEVVTANKVPKNFRATHVKHYGYDLDAYKSVVGPNSLYGRAQGILFDPVLPFYFENRIHKSNRTIKGARTALNGARDKDYGRRADGEDAKLTHSSPIFYTDVGDYGQLGIEYWVLEHDSKHAPNKAFVNGSKPIVLTVNGQTHAEWPSNILRKEAGLMHLASRMVVHLDCNRLSPDAKRVLFVSNREESRRSTVQAVLHNDLLEALEADDELRTLEQAARHAGAREKDEKAEKEMRKEVAKMLKVFGFSIAEEGPAGGSGGDPGPGGGKPRPPRPKPTAIVIKEPPTFVEIVGEPPLRLYPGQRRFIRLRTDATSTYHDPHNRDGSKFNFLIDGAGLSVAGTSALRHGHMRVVIAASSDCVVGAAGKLRVELYRTGLSPLAAEVDLSLVKPPEPAKGNEKVKLPRIEIHALKGPDDPQWIDLDWPEDDVAQVAFEYQYDKPQDTLSIYYSTAFPRFDDAFSAVAAKDLPTSVSFQKRYEMWLTAISFVHWQDVESDATKMTDESIDQDRLDDYRRDELRRFGKMAVLYTQRELAHDRNVAEAAEDA